jgi:hypothetical protein
MKRILALSFVLLFSLAAVAKDAPPTIMLWPTPEKPIVRFAFGKFVKLGSMATQNSYSVDVIADNLWDKPISLASFEVYFFSKDNVRIGSGYITLNNLGVKETVRFAVPFGAAGAPPVSFKIVSTNLPRELGPAAAPRKIRLTVYSVPAGANLKVDGTDVGVTPKQVEFTLGKHALQFSMTGYYSGSYPVELGPDDVSGGTVSYELGALAHDTIEMRDGTTLNADVETVNATTVTAHIGGSLQSLDRNQVKRILFTQRDPINGEQSK